MKLAVAPLTTGTYVVGYQGKYYGVHNDIDGTKLGLIEDEGHESIKWYIEKVGENRFKPRNTSSDVTVSPDKQAVEVTTSKGEYEWFIEPTDVDGEFTGGPIHDKPLFAKAIPGEATVKLVPQSEKTRFTLYRVDDD